MIPHTNTKTVLLPPILSTAAMVQNMSFDAKGFDYCTIDIIGGTSVTTTQMFDTIRVFEHDTTTAATSMTQIVALSGSTATNATYGFAIGTLSATTIGHVITLQFGLKGKKRYIGLSLLASAAGGAGVICAIAKLSRAETAPTTAVLKDGENLADTAVTGCMTLVTTE
ncbi:hypothetical protein LCGC14_1805040 [marine sediment metagenome]|uniref:Uncharacterized protein n=1 Tax=marine sediment metagenome TaxID=412755 RepID=A0A0F9JN53_9ZZZZ